MLLWIGKCTILSGEIPMRPPIHHVYTEKLLFHQSSRHSNFTGLHSDGAVVVNYWQLDLQMAMWIRLVSVRIQISSKQYTQTTCQVYWSNCLEVSKQTVERSCLGKCIYFECWNMSILNKIVWINLKGHWNSVGQVVCKFFDGNVVNIILINNSVIFWCDFWVSQKTCFRMLIFWKTVLIILR